ncbi:acyl-CoA dehydrogenase family protein [Nocardioides sambongensis]|uniref:acyl-CoA dehydrogenase family protein n=1 Tax=Nocardioides sambongensis TaxID=2589074 RepID=UPI00112D2BC6|nr:acyl-CoA dehydrogenase family protein [Nocardioides sambongensis]
MSTNVLATPADVDLLPTQDGEDLRAAVRSVLAAQCDPTAVIACYDGDRSVVAPLWRALAVDLGLAGLLVPEEHGGHGATARDAAVVLEELGAAVAPVPFLTSSVLATGLLASPTATDAAAEVLTALAAGEQVATLVVPWSTGPGDVPLLGSDGGAVRSVAGAVEADVLLVPVAAAGGTEVRAVPVAAAEVTGVPSLDMTRQLADVRVSAEALAAAPVVVADADAALTDALTLGAALLASEQAGIIRWCVTTTVAYLKERRQFGRVVGGFQALKHRLADLYVEAEQATAAATWAAATAAEGAGPDAGPDEARLASAVAASYCSRVAVHAAEETVQLHAGIAMTWEHPAHLALKRAKSDQIALGSPEQHHVIVADLARLPGPTAG